MSVKSLIRLSPGREVGQLGREHLKGRVNHPSGVEVTKLFYSSPTAGRNKLARLSLPSFFRLDRGARYLTGENLKVVWAEFSTLS